MAKLYFYYGAMGSSKTATALMVHYNYKEVGKNAILLKPLIDTRDGQNIIKSRIGLSNECVLLEDFMNNYKEEDIKKLDCVIVDEAQFATKEQIDFLSEIVDAYNIPVMCYGLRADFRNELFSGSERLLAIADTIQEVKTVCWCGKKALCNARFNENGEIERDGEQVVLGSNSKYVALCRKHYKLGQIRPRT